MRGAIGHFFRRRWVVAVLVLAALAGMGAAGWSHWTTTQLLRHGEEALAAREYAKARDLLGQYLEARPGDARAHLLAARAARRLREYYEARDHLRRCREEGGDTEAIEIEDALIDVQRGDDGPVEWLRARGEKDDELALVILRNGERQAAVRWLKKMAVRLDPGHQPAQKALAEASSLQP